MARGSTSNPAQNTQTSANPQTQPVNPKGNNNPKEQAPEPQEETKENAKKMGWKGLGGRILNLASSDFSYKGPQGNHFNLMQLFSRKTADESGETNKKTNLTPKEILGEIYKAMVKLDTYRKLQYQETKNHLQEQNLDKNRKNKELIKALMGLVPKKSEEPAKEESNTANTSASTAGTPGTPPQNPVPNVDNKTAAATTAVATTAAVVTSTKSNATAPSSVNTTATKQTTTPNDTSAYHPVRVTSGMGFRTNLFDPSKRENHLGVDIHADEGTEIYSIGPGVISEVGENPMNGKYVKLKLNDGRTADYLHLSDTSAAIKGAQVDRGTLIGKSGNTGYSKAPHLHFGLRDEKSKPIQPSQKEMEQTINTKDVLDKHHEEMAKVDQVKKQETPVTKVENKPNDANQTATQNTQVNTTPQTATKLPNNLMDDGRVELQSGDLGYSNFLSSLFQKGNPNKLQRDFDGNWHYEDGSLVTDQKKKYSAERRWLLKTYGLLAGTKISADDLKKIGLSGEAIKQYDGWHIIKDKQDNLIKDIPTIDKLEKLGRDTYVSELKNDNGNKIDKSSFDNRDYKETLLATSNESSSSQNTIIINKKDSIREYAKVDDSNPYTQKLG